MLTNRKTILVLLSMVVLVLAACNGGTPTIDPAAAVMTNAAGTVAVELTKAADVQPTETQVPTETPVADVTDTPAITNTPVPSNTPITSGGGNPGGTGGTCDLAGFVADVTVPDGTDFDPGESFTKTWRLSNNGTCTWNTSYTVVFADGEQMTTASSIALTSSVAPNDTVDISIDMTAPSTTGNYLGNWYLKNDTGQIFGLPGPFYVEINVTSTGGPTATLGTGTPTVTATSGAGGSNSVTLSTNAKGSVNDDNTVTGNAYTGDDTADNGQQAFVSFDISGIPSNATIDKVTVDFSSFDTLSNPFGAIGCLNAFPGNFFPLEASDYVSGGAPGGALAVWCDSGSLSTAASNDAIKNHLQSILGSSEMQLRLQFSSETDSDAADDMVRFTNPKLIIEYTVP